MKSKIIKQVELAVKQLEKNIVVNRNRLKANPSDKAHKTALKYNQADLAILRRVLKVLVKLH